MSALMSNRMKRLSWILILLLAGSCAYAQEAEEAVNWDKIEYHLFRELKAEGGKSDAEIHQAVGYALLKAHNMWERATAHFKKAVEFDPKLYWSWYNLGLIYPDTEEGREYFRKSIEAKPDFASSYYWLAYSYCRDKLDEEALVVFEKYLQVADESDPNESGRIEVAKKVLQDLRSGKEGKDLRMLRRQFYPEDIPFYMVIIGVAETLEKAEGLAKVLVEKPSVIYDGDWDYMMDGSTGTGLGIYETKLWEGFEPGHFAISDGLFTSKEEAQELRDKLKADIPDAYIKKVVNPRVQEILGLSFDKWVIWSGLGTADFEEIHFTDLKTGKDIRLCFGRRRPEPRGNMMIHAFDSEIEPLQVDRKERCYYFYSGGLKAFYFDDRSIKDVEIDDEKRNKIKKSVLDYIGDSEADVKIRWLIGDRACASLQQPLTKEELGPALTDFQHHKRTLFKLKLENNAWNVVVKEDQAYEVTTVCYH
ncbi:tetratricopeptide repeat protein [Candidatus Omnitrophota bacterium]